MNSPESTTSSSLSLKSCKCGEDLTKEPASLCCPNTQKTKKSNSLTSLAQNFRRGRTLNFTTKRGRKNSRQQKENVTSSPACSGGTKKSPKWVMKFNCTKKERKCTTTTTSTTTVEDPRQMKCCVCTCYRRTDEHHLGAGVVFEQQSHESNASEDAPETQSIETDLDESRDEPENSSLDESIQEISDDSNTARTTPVIYGNIASSNSIVLEPEPESPFLSWIKEVDILEDCDEHARLQRAREIAEGVEAPANFRPFKHLQVLCPSDPDQLLDGSFTNARRLQIVCPPNLTVTVDSLRSLFQSNVTLRSCPLDTITGCHTQVDYIHCLVPDLLNITKCSFYWGKMDRYEAERLLDGKPEGTFLLRDSAQEEFLFSVSFRKYTRSLHARIEQWNHKFSFDSHDPSVFASDTVCGLIEHYKDPSSCMFFEPMLTLPLHRNFTFSLQHLCRAVITSRLNYDSVNQLQLPKSLKSYLKEYHYRQKIRVNRFDDDMPWIDLRPLDRDSPYN